MITISTREQLAEMVDKNKDLIVDDNMTIEFSTTRDEIRNVKCDNLFMLKNGEYFNLNIGGHFTGRDFTGWDFTGGHFTGGDFTGWDFTGRHFTGWDFTGWDFTGGNFTGRDFTGWDFTGGDFTGRNFTGWNFTGGNISYYAFFCCYGRVIKHGKIEGRHPKAHPPIELAKNKG